MDTLKRVAKLSEYQLQRTIADHAIVHASIAAENQNHRLIPVGEFARITAACYRLRGAAAAARTLAAFRKAYNLAARSRDLPTIRCSSLAKSIQASLNAYLEPAEIEEVRQAYEAQPWPRT